MREGKKVLLQESAEQDARVKSRKKSKFGNPPFVTRSTDKRGRLVDYIRHEKCGGKGCAGCSNLGFHKQLVAL